MPKSCPFCNAAMGIKALYCPRCGKKQPKLTESEIQALREKDARDRRQKAEAMRPAETGETHSERLGDYSPTRPRDTRDESDYAVPEPPRQPRVESSSPPREEVANPYQQRFNAEVLDDEPPARNRRPYYLLGLVPLVMLGIFFLSRTPAASPYETPAVAQITPTPLPTLAPTPTPEPTPSPTPTPEPMEQLSAYLDRGEARTYKPYTLTDSNAANIPVMSTVLPSGWAGTGIVLWDAHSSEKPGRYVFTAVTTDSQAGLTMSSAMRFVDVRLDINVELPMDYVLPGLPKQAVLNESDICARFVPTFNSNISDVSVSGGYEVDASAATAQYSANMDSFFNALRNAGLQVDAPYVSAKKLTATGVVNGTQCDLAIDMVTSGFSCVDYTNGFGIYMDYWNLDYLCVYYAPAGQMGSYQQDMDLIMSNMYANQSWEELNDTVAAEVNAYLSQNMNATYNDMVQFAQGTLTAAGSTANTSTGYARYDAVANIEFAGGETAFRGIAGASFTANVESKWTQVWTAESGDMIAISDEEYDPNEDATQSGQSWSKAS